MLKELLVTKDIRKTLCEKLRFIDNKDGTITDTKTNLMWTEDGNLFNKRMTGEHMTLDRAKKVIKKLKIGGYRDWRLPTKEEFEVFVKAGIIRAVFKNTAPYQVGYWTSSTHPKETDYVWTADIDKMSVEDIGSKGLLGDENVWPVRSN